MCCVSCAVPRSGAAGLGLAKLIVFPLRRCGRAILAFIHAGCVPPAAMCDAWQQVVSPVFFTMQCRGRRGRMPSAESLYANGGNIVCKWQNHCMPVLRQWAALFARNGFFCCRHRMPRGFVKVRSSQPALPSCGGRCACICRFAYLIGDFNQKFYYRAARARRLQMMAISLIFAQAACRLVCLPCV